MKILSTILLISFMTVFAATANAGSGGTAPQPNKPRLATCKDCVDAGYRRGYADAEAIALENTVAGSSSVTTPLSYRKPVYVQAPTTQPQPRYVNAPAVESAPRKLPSYVQRMQPKVQPTVPNMQPKQRRAVQQIQQMQRHAGHGHHTQAQMIDCELTDSLNRGAGPVTTVISTQKYYQPVAPAKHTYKPVRKFEPMKPVANFKHGDHYHHTDAERADCALTDSLNRQAGPVSTVIHSTKVHNHSPVKQYLHQNYAHGNHAHHSEAERADCALTDSLNRGGSVVKVVRKY